ncbi:adenylosuccinate lyase [Intrasporangium oryzae NRRL B-24470]|uniref:Adenylosuccinate lyase n=1 Tax=Intrasporangium oryzae NRRL B-24470 TaxID=1386089 RepID=W9GD06_9MICO|nr:lyase family protein [Intrasporangium oryzae]EWT02708.1 adenylosuccinate lyase [Intrasporangium oryzae NRRL B-24470]
MTMLSPGSHRLPDLASDGAVLGALVEVEVAWVRTQERLGLVTRAVTDAVSALGATVGRAVDEIARDAEPGGNPVIPVVHALRRAVGATPGASTAVHRGLTSQDVVDTALMILAHRALGAALESLVRAADAAAGHARAHRHTVMSARTLGQPALPTTFGAKAAGWLGALDDAIDELRTVRASLPAQCGGAVGTLSLVEALTPGRALEAAEIFADEVGLVAARPWHTDRSPVTRLGDALTRTADALAKVAGDVILLSRPEIGEVAEPAADGRGGSSTLPHKRNPVLSVLVRAVGIEAPHLAATLHTAAALAADERPDGAWHAEWGALTRLLSRVPVAAAQLADVLCGLEVHNDAMSRNVRAVGPALVAERILQLLPSLPGGEALVPDVRDALRRGGSGDEVRALLAEGLDGRGPEGEALDARVDDLLDPAAYLGVAALLVDQALERHASHRDRAGSVTR